MGVKVRCSARVVRSTALPSNPRSGWPVLLSKLKGCCRAALVRQQHKLRSGQPAVGYKSATGLIKTRTAHCDGRVFETSGLSRWSRPQTGTPLKGQYPRRLLITYSAHSSKWWQRCSL